MFGSSNAVNSQDRNERTPSTVQIAFLLLGGVAAILVLNFVFTIGAKRIDYADLFKSDDAGPFIRQVFLPHLAIALVTAVLITRYKLWREIRLSVPRGLLRWLFALIPIAAVIALIDYRYVGSGGGPWGGMAALLAFAMVGLNEELLFRGFGLAALTRIHGTRKAWILSSLLFGVAHAVNALLGQPIGSAIAQVVSTTIMGLLFGLFVLGTRSLVAAMILHGLWDYLITTHSWASELSGSFFGTTVAFELALISTFVLALWVMATHRSKGRVVFATRPLD